MYFIVVKFDVKPEYVDQWMDIVSDFTKATRKEPGNLWFEWNRNIDNPNVFTLVEAFTEEGGPTHTNSDHFKKAMEDMRPAVTATPKIVSRLVDGNDWDEMGELKID